MNRKRSLTPAYAAVQASFWMGFCVSVSYAAVYLQGLGYSNASLGLVTAFGSLLGALVGPLLSARIDRSERVSAAGLCMPLLILQLLTLVLLWLHPQKDAVSSACFALYICFSLSVNSMNLKLYSDAVYAGLVIDYGFCRGMGSLMYVFVSLLLGAAVERSSIRVLPLTGILLTLAQMAAFFVFRRYLPRVSSRTADSTPRGSSMAVFMRRNPRFCVLLAGTLLLFIAHSTVTNYLINVTRNVGGDTRTMGYLNGFMAAVEIPVIMFFTPLFGKRSSASLLRTAFVLFTLKGAAIALASSVLQLGAAFLLQAPSFALYTAAIVPYVGRIVAYEDSAKAQSLAFTMTTLGSVLASVIGGWLYDHISVSATLWIACGVCALGSLISLAGVEKRRV